MLARNSSRILRCNTHVALLDLHRRAVVWAPTHSFGSMLGSHHKNRRHRWTLCPLGLALDTPPGLLGSTPLVHWPGLSLQPCTFLIRFPSFLCDFSLTLPSHNFIPLSLVFARSNLGRTSCSTPSFFPLCFVVTFVSNSQASLLGIDRFSPL